MATMRKIAFAAALVASLQAVQANAAGRLKYSIDGYIQEGLVLHYDGIRNQGADKPHDPDAVTWKNLGSWGPAYDMPRHSRVNSGWEAGDQEGAWAEDGFVFGGKSIFHDHANFQAWTIPESYTLQTRVDAAAESQSGNIGYLLCPYNDNTAGGDDNTVQDGGWQKNDWARFSLGVRKNAYKYVTSLSQSMYLCIGDDAGNRVAISEAPYSYATAMLDSKTNAVIFSGASAPSWTSADSNDHRSRTSAGSSAWADGTGGRTKRTFGKGVSIGGHYPRTDETFSGTVKSLRFYNRVLSDEELAWNRAIDRVRFDGEEIPETNVVVASSIDGLCGVETNGAHFVTGGDYAFTATNMVLNGVLYAPIGCTLETWDGSGWGSPELVEGASCTVDGSSTVRITWQWRPSYVEDGLVLNFDGIENAGRGMQHDTSARIWVNLGSAGADCDAKYELPAFKNPGYDGLAPDGGRWLADGYRFEGFSKFVASNFNYSTNLTVQVLTDASIAGQQNPHPAENNHDYVFSGSYADFALSTYKGLDEDEGVYNSVFFRTQGTNAVNPRIDYSDTSSPMGYVTAILNSDEKYASIFSGTKAPAADGAGRHSYETVTNPTITTVAVGGWGRTADHTGYLIGAVKFFRYYDRVLSDEEIAANRSIDEIRYGARGSAAVGATGSLVLKSNVAGVSGRELNGAYFLGPTNYVFSAPFKTVAANGFTYKLLGYRLDGGERVPGAAYMWTGDASTPNVELEWQWEMVGGLDTTGGSLSDYYQEGLRLHLDGIENVGAGLPHDGGATNWVNVSTYEYAIGGEAFFSSLMPPVEDPWTNRLESGWSHDGYYFSGHRYATMDRALPANTLERKVQIQVVCDVDTDLLRSRYAAQNAADVNGQSAWPTLVGTTSNVDGIMSLFYSAGLPDAEDYDTLRFKFGESNLNHQVSYGVHGWGGQYASALHNYNSSSGKSDGAIYETELPKEWKDTGLDHDVGALTAVVGSSSGSYTGAHEHQNYLNHMLVGKVKSVRIYSWPLDTATHRQNWAVDNIRFHRTAPGETNVTVVACYGGAASAGTGVYNVIGTYSFSAWDATTRLGSARELLGYSVQTWNGSGWSMPEYVENPRTNVIGKMTYTYDAGGISVSPAVDGATPVRLVWLWKTPGVAVLYR